MTFLNLGAEYSNSPLTIVIYSDSLGNFDNKPADYYIGKNICVGGKVKIYKGKAEIIVNSEHNITVK
jgi:DNA/RNA endonuclease YhcR with UshA esterase domain